MLISGIGTLATAVNLVTTILVMRAPGMSLGRVPLFVWMMMFDGVLLIFALPPITAALIMLLFDRGLGAHFFDTQAGGSALLWQHLFWFFGHPEVYIMALPGLRNYFRGRARLFAQSDLRLRIGRGSDGGDRRHLDGRLGSSHVYRRHERRAGCHFLWRDIHDRRADGHQDVQLDRHDLRRKIAHGIPDAVRAGFLAMFLIGGLTGIMLAAVPIDWQVSDSYFVVGHFHYVLFGGSLFAIMAAYYYWFPKVTGRLMDERLARWHFWLMFVGFQPDVFPDAHCGLARHAATDLHLFSRPRLDDLESGLHGRRHRSWPSASCSSSGTCLFRYVVVQRAATTLGTPGPWNGPRRRRRHITTSNRFRWYVAADRCGI